MSVPRIDIFDFLTSLASSSEVDNINLGVLPVVSQVLDSSAKRIFSRVQDYLIPRLKYAVASLNEPRLAGRCGTINSILGNYTPFEQIVALDQWVKQHPNISKIHTWRFGVLGNLEVEGEIPPWLRRNQHPDSDQIVPIRLSPRSSNLTLMNVFVGTSRGISKGPSYQRGDWIRLDPRTSPPQNALINPLNALEMVRNPEAALLLKANAFDTGLVSHDFRYRVFEDNTTTFSRLASVELPQQKSLATRLVKAQAAGSNLFYLISHKKHRNLLSPCLYEDYFSEGYRDDELPYVSPLQIVKALKEVVRGNTHLLDSTMKKLLAAQLRISLIPEVKTLTGNYLFETTYRS